MADNFPDPAARCFLIAEAGVNHNGKLDMALQLVEAAREAGADAIKFQTFKADLLAARSAPKAAYQEAAAGGAEPGAGQWRMLKDLELAAADFEAIQAACERRGLEFLSTPFDEESALLLRRLGVRRFKVGSGDLTNLPLLRTIGRFGQPVLLSTGMATDAEISEALEALDGAGAPQVALLHCISQYPAPPETLQLFRIPGLRGRFARPVGYSDHSLGWDAALCARALGAGVIEKHLTLDRTLPGPDHAASADPREFAELSKRLRIVESMLGGPGRTFHADEETLRSVARKSIVAVRPIRSGDVLSAGNIGLLRPGTGLPPRHWDEVLGRRAAQDIPEGEPLRWEMVQ